MAYDMKNICVQYIFVYTL